MKREEYEEIIRQNTVLDEEVLKATRSLLIEERRSDFRVIEGILEASPIEKPPPEIGLPRETFYEVEITQSKAKRILSALHEAQSMYGPTATFGTRPLATLSTAWAQYCIERSSKRRKKQAS